MVRRLLLPGRVRQPALEYVDLLHVQPGRQWVRYHVDAEARAEAARTHHPRPTVDAHHGRARPAMSRRFKFLAGAWVALLALGAASVAVLPHHEPPVPDLADMVYPGCRTTPIAQMTMEKLAECQPYQQYLRTQRAFAALQAEAAAGKTNAITPARTAPATAR